MSLVDDFATGMAQAIERMGQPCKVAGKTVNGIFSNDYEPVELGLGGRQVSVQSNMPMVTCSTAALPSTLAHGSAVVFDEVNYTVVEVMPQTGGVTEIRLREDT